MALCVCLSGSMELSPAHGLGVQPGGERPEPSFVCLHLVSLGLGHLDGLVEEVHGTQTWVSWVPRPTSNLSTRA